MHKNFRNIIFISAIIFLAKDLSGQNSVELPSINCPVENIEVHLSQEGVFTGEILWFKIYCTSSVFPGEELSSLAFVELVSSENNSILRKKILLKHGAGSGEFEIPNNLPTGLYYIISYTNWMKNFGEGSFRRKEISIINPDRKFTSGSIPDSLKSIIKSLEFAPRKDLLRVIPDKKKYSAREHVTLTILSNGLPGEKLSGDFSVSVCRKEPEMIFFNRKNSKERLIRIPENITYLPDYKGIRMSGKLIDPSGNAVSNAFITVSTPGPGTDLNGSITDNSGIFNFLFKPVEGEQEMVVTLPGNEMKSSLEELFWNGFRDPPDNFLFNLDQEAISYLKEKYIHLQFQNRFEKSSFIKSPQPKTKKDSTIFYSKPYKLIELKNYINLDSLRE